VSKALFWDLMVIFIEFVTYAVLSGFLSGFWERLWRLFGWSFFLEIDRVLNGIAP
jgi:hypothetical protein